MTILPNGVAVCDGDATAPWIMERGLCYDQMVKPSIVPLLKPGDWVVDGGASIGDHTSAYLEAVGPTGKVFAFEPGSESFQCLKLNCPAAITINRMLWHERVSMWLMLSRGAMGGSHFSFAIPSASEPHDGPVQSVVLDDYDLDRLNLFKLDMEGAEYYALLGAEQTIIRCRPKLVLEMNSAIAARAGYTGKDIYDLLEKWNYRHYSISGAKEPYCTNCDIVAIPN
jgi:FkbM family methyltransferase